MGPEDLEARVSALESQVGDLRRRMRASEQDAQAARVLAGAADRDVTDMGGEVRGLRGEVTDFRREVRGEFNGLRAEVRENHREFTDFRKATMASFNAMRADMNAGFKRVDDEFSKVDNGFTEMRAKFDLAAAGQQQIVGLIQGLIDDRGGDPR